MHDTQAPADGSERYRFGIFEFDGRTLELTKAGRSISLRPQPLKLLALLLARPEELISRDELQRALWAGDTFVEASATLVGYAAAAGVRRWPSQPERRSCTGDGGRGRRPQQALRDRPGP